MSAEFGASSLVGRAAELTLIKDLLRRGLPSGVVVVGAAGVGKTRFAAEARRAAEDAGWATAWATATRAAASIPFGAVAHLLPEPAPGPAGRLDLLRQAGRSLSERFARERRLVLVIDDAHLLDDASAALAHQLAATATAFVILTVRSGAPNLDPILTLWKDGVADHLELRPLAHAEVSRLITGTLGGHVEGATLRRFWEVTRGNALFLRELIVQGLERGTLSDAGGIWRWTGSIEPGARLGEIVESRLGQLSDDQLDALELVALGEPIGVTLLERLAARGSLEQLQRRGLLSVEPGGRRLDVRLAHPLYGETLRARTRLRRGIIARLADALEATGARRREDVLRLAGWRLAAGADGPPGLFIAAAGRALASFDPVLAERLARAAIAGGGGFAAHQALGAALMAQGRSAEAEAVLAELGPMTASEAERALVADSRAANLFWGLGQPGEAERVLLRAEGELGDTELRDELAAMRGAISAFLGRPAEALAVSRPILGRGETVGRACARAGLATMTALLLTGGSAEARALVGRLREPALRLADDLPFLPRQLLGAYSVVLGLAGWLEESAAEAERGYERSLAEHSHEATALWAMVLGRARLGRGELRGARALLQEGAALFDEADPIGYGSVCRALLSQAHALAGDHADARRALTQAEAARGHAFRLFDAELGLARAWTAAAGGEFSQARAEALRAAEQAEAHGQPAYAALAWHELARLGDPARAAPRLRAHAEALDGPLPPAYAAHSAALAAGDAGALDRAAADFEAVGAWLLAAEARAEAAAAHQERGRTASAARSAARAGLLAERCQPARTPALARAGPATVLTRREHEVATLAADGLSNRAIADRLGLSVRTVEHHLQHAYDKLGVSDRGQLEDIVRPGRAQARLRGSGA